MAALVAAGLVDATGVDACEHAASDAASSAAQGCGMRGVCVIRQLLVASNTVLVSAKVPNC
jgi:hypothetical protein